MAAFRFLLVVQLVVLACATLGVDSAEAARRPCYARLFSFGDSLTDNGNWLRYARSPGAVARPPYGETFFRRPNGRFCDGRIIIDYIGMYVRSSMIREHRRTRAHVALVSVQPRRWGYRS